MERREFELTTRERKALLKAAKPQPAMFLPGGRPMYRSQQERANEAWAKLGKKYGFDSSTVEPVSGKADTVFTAEVVDVEDGEVR